MCSKIMRLWNNLPLYWKTFALSMILATSVVIIGEGAEGLAKRFIRHANLPISSNVREAALWLIAIVVSGLLGSLIISRIITGAFSRIQPVVERLSEGDLSSRVNPTDTRRGDEIGSLGRSFNQMADNITRLLENERTLIRDISHELRSPLTRMKMSLALLREDVGPDEGIQSQIKQLNKDVDRMESMVGQSLERARLETMEKTGFDRGEMDLAAMVLDSIEEQTPSAADENKPIHFQGLKSAPYVGNALILGRAVDNLIKNALYYTAAGSRVSVNLRSASNAFVLEVADQGPGVPEEHLENIFRPFYRVDSARARNSGGFGLGLAIARQATQLHGGQVTAVNIGNYKQMPAGPESTGEAVLGRGLKVTLTLPLTGNKTDHDV